jgi:hypothetical protein
MGIFGGWSVPPTRSIAEHADRYHVRRWRRAVLCAALSTALSAALAQPTQTEPNGKAAMSVLARAAQTVGIRQCFTAIDQVASRVLIGSQRQDVVLDWNHITPDSAAFFSLTGFQYEGKPAILSLSTVPDNAGHCAILAERISVNAGTCVRVAKEQLAGYRGTPLVADITVYTQPSRPRETVTLSDVEGGCLIVRRQVEYEWPAGSVSADSRQ